MKKHCASIVTLILTALCAMPALAATTTFTGTVTDEVCGAHHMMPGKPAAACTRLCVKRGAKYALAVGNDVYILEGKTAEVDALAGAKATVTGDLKGDVITVESIAAAQ